MYTTQSEREANDAQDPWVLQLIVNLPKNTTATHEQICAAAALATAAVTADPEFSEANAAYWNTRIRKHTRRARGAAFTRTEEHPGHTRHAQDATVRALAPTRAAEIPEPVRKLQLQGLDRPRTEPVHTPVTDPSRPVLHITVNPDLTTGKAAAAAAHTTQIAWNTSDPDLRAAWAANHHAVTVTCAATNPNNPIVIQDAGFTEVTPGTITATATWDP